MSGRYARQSHPKVPFLEHPKTFYLRFPHFGPFSRESAAVSYGRNTTFFLFFYFLTHIDVKGLMVTFIIEITFFFSFFFVSTCHYACICLITFFHKYQHIGLIDLIFIFSFLWGPCRHGDETKWIYSGTM